MPSDESPTDPSEFSLRGLPEWVKSFGLPPAAEAAIDRYWKPAWDAIKDELPLLPVQVNRPSPAVVDATRIAHEQIRFEAVSETQPGEAWRNRFEAMWPAYRAWYLRDGDTARPDLATCRARLRQHMPELMPTYERLVELAGGDELAARFLSLYRPPGFIVGCSQGVWTRGAPVLVRNYDYPASRLEGVISRSAWNGRQIIGMSDCLWGLLDGINDAGLAVSLTFGGRQAVGDGFAIPLIVRYLLETCATVDEARTALVRLPVHAAQNLTLLDRTGESITAFVAPDRPTRLTDVAVTTNHQDLNDWPEYTRAVRSVERQRCLLTLLDDPQLSSAQFIESFLAPPVYGTGYSTGMGTLYTAAYFPAEGRAEYRWPGHTWPQSFERFAETAHVETYAESAVADSATVLPK
jgi:predicted choloylglycine hydrolase